jgi:hypothetical protein
MGKGASVSCLARLLHPARVIQYHFPNMHSKKQLAGLIVLRKETKTINRKQQKALVCQHDLVKSGDSHIEIYASTKHFTLLIEGPSDQYFGEYSNDGRNIEGDTVHVPLSEEVYELVRSRNNNRPVDEDDVMQLLAEIEIDNDNEPAPENVATLTIIILNVSTTLSGVIPEFVIGKKKVHVTTIPA